MTYRGKSRNTGARAYRGRWAEMNAMPAPPVSENPAPFEEDPLWRSFFGMKEFSSITLDGKKLHLLWNNKTEQFGLLDGRDAIRWLSDDQLIASIEADRLLNAPIAIPAHVPTRPEQTIAAILWQRAFRLVAGIAVKNDYVTCLEHPELGIGRVVGKSASPVSERVDVWWAGRRGSLEDHLLATPRSVIRPLRCSKARAEKMYNRQWMANTAPPKITEEAIAPRERWQKIIILLSAPDTTYTGKAPRKLYANDEKMVMPVFAYSLSRVFGWGLPNNASNATAFTLLSEVVSETQAMSLFKSFVMEVLVGLDPSEGWSMKHSEIVEWVESKNSPAPVEGEGENPTVVIIPFPVEQPENEGEKKVASVLRLAKTSPRSRRPGLAHIALSGPISRGNYRRAAGDPLCKPAEQFKYNFLDDMDIPSGVTVCKNCIERAGKYGVPFPEDTEVTQPPTSKTLTAGDPPVEYDPMSKWFGYSFGIPVGGQWRKWRWITNRCSCAHCGGRITYLRSEEEVRGISWERYYICSSGHPVRDERDLTSAGQFVLINAGADGAEYDATAILDAYPHLTVVDDDDYDLAI